MELIVQALDHTIVGRVVEITVRRSQFPSGVYKVDILVNLARQENECFRDGWLRCTAMKLCSRAGNKHSRRITTVKTLC